VSGDKSVRRSAQDDDFVGSSEEKHSQASLVSSLAIEKYGLLLFASLPQKAELSHRLSG
jgi:hypothetical protein